MMFPSREVVGEIGRDGTDGTEAFGMVMKFPNREEQQKLVRQRETTGREVDSFRREALRGMPYNWEDVDALLSLGDDIPSNEHNGEGLIEMQRIFMKADPRKRR